MTSTSRLSNSSSELLRAPYAAPQPATPSPFAASRVAKLTPFVPQDYRGDNARATPAATSSPTPAIGNVVIEHDAVEENVSALPWIEAFVQDSVPNSNGDEHSESASEDTWPMGEAAKRLDELTESLTSIDASRALLNAEKTTTDTSSELPPAHSMWNDDEWMDIMPTSAIAAEQLVDVAREESPIPEWHAEPEIEEATAFAETFEADAFSTAEPTGEELSQPDIANVDFSEAMSASYQHAEITARALEGLAQRVRAGEVPVPAVQQDLGDAAVLAGVLASLLGWRR